MRTGNVLLALAGLSAQVLGDPVCQPPTDSRKVVCTDSGPTIGTLKIASGVTTITLTTFESGNGGASYACATPDTQCGGGRGAQISGPINIPVGPGSNLSYSLGGEGVMGVEGQASVPGPVSLFVRLLPAHADRIV